MGLKDFRKLKKLGAGSFGAVFKVRRIKDGETYALKEVDMRRLSPREQEDAVNEIRLLASMRHHNIVRYCEAFVEREKLYIVLEFARYGDLSGVLKKQKEKRKYFSERRVMTMFIQICKAMHHLHAHNVLHRDLKPQNVFVGDDGALKLGDFGCSKLLDRVMLARTQCGTPYYMSPEIYENKRYDAKSDVWALGCILYELASLAVPFKARSLPQLARKVSTSKTPLIPSAFSSNLRRLAKALLAKDPRKRPSLRQILNLSFVKDFIEENRHRLEPPKNTSPAKMNLLRTIVVPKGRGGLRRLNFPESKYPRGRPQSSPAKRSIPEKIKISRVRQSSFALAGALPRISRGMVQRKHGGAAAAGRPYVGRALRWNQDARKENVDVRHVRKPLVRPLVRRPPNRPFRF